MTDLTRTDFDHFQAAIDKRLEQHTDELKEIRRTLEAIAVQKNRLDTLEKTTNDLWLKYDSLCAPGGTISVMERHQASCPRQQVRAMWVIVIPTVITVLVGMIAILEKL